MKAIVVGHREERETQYGVDLLSPEGIYKSDRHPISGLDRIGIGDSMAAAFQASLLSSSGNSNFSAEDMKRAAQYGSAAGAMKYSIHGDTAGLRMIELKELVDGGYRAVQR
jgi:sugar/nucleoside kinase (ribokinase family)